MIRIGKEFDLPGPGVFFCGFEQERPHAPTIGDRSIEIPLGAGHLQTFKEPSRQQHGGKRFLDAMVGPMQAGQVADAAVTSFKQDSAGQGAFHGDKEIVTVNGHYPAFQSSRINVMTCAPLQGGIGARGPLQGHALPRIELVMIAGQFEGGFFRVAARVEERQIRRARAQPRQATLAEQPIIFGMPPPMPLLIGHGM